MAPTDNPNQRQQHQQRDVIGCCALACRTCMLSWLGRPSCRPSVTWLTTANPRYSLPQDGLPWPPRAAATFGVVAKRNQSTEQRPPVAKCVRFYPPCHAPASGQCVVVVVVVVVVTWQQQGGSFPQREQAALCRPKKTVF